MIVVFEHNDAMLEAAYDKRLSTLSLRQAS